MIAKKIYRQRDFPGFDFKIILVRLCLIPEKFEKKYKKENREKKL